MKLMCGSDGGHSDKSSVDSSGNENSCAGGDNSVDGHISEDPLSANTSRSGDIGTGKENVLSVKKELIYTRRFKEGYDIFDPQYVCWLQKHYQKSRKLQGP